MKSLLLLILTTGVVLSFGQIPEKVPNEWDIFFQRTKLEIQKYENAVQNKLLYTDTVTSKQSLIITYFSESKVKLKKIANSLDSNGCTIGIFTNYYNAFELVSYAFGYKKCCPGEEQDDYKCFERVTEYERFEYDNINRVLIHVFHVTTPMTFKETFTYDKDGTKHVNRVKITEPKFWEQ